jgi:hypothetical protein
MARQISQYSEVEQYDLPSVVAQFELVAVLILTFKGFRKSDATGRPEWRSDHRSFMRMRMTV